MSRRLRIEEETLKRLQEEKDEENDAYKQFQESLYAPIIWHRLANGIKIQDLKEPHYNPVLKLIEEHFMNEDIFCINTKILEDPVSKASYLNRILFNMKSHVSVVALDETQEDFLAGVLILKVVNRHEFGSVFSRVNLIDGESYRKILDFTSYLNRKVDIYEHFDCDVFLRYYLLCIHPDYRTQGLGFQLFRVGFDVARSLRIPVVMGLFSNFKIQKLAQRIGLKKCLEIFYTSWLDEDKQLVFCNPGTGNFTCAAMAGLVPPAPPRLAEPPKIPEEKPQSKSKMSRAEKRKAKGKAKSMK